MSIGTEKNAWGSIISSLLSTLGFVCLNFHMRLNASYNTGLQIRLVSQPEATVAQRTNQHYLP